MAGSEASSPSSYYAVIFTSRRRGSDDDGYAQAAARMEALAAGQPGFLGIESARGPDGFGITVSYWSSLEAIALWREQPEHREAQRRGQREWYESYHLRIAEVTREYAGPRPA